MGTTQPIRNRKELQKFSTYYQTVKPHPRNYALIILGLNTALRISDLLQLQWFDVYDFYTQRFREHLLILEQKTGKQNYIALNKNAKNALRWYMDACFPQESDYLFCKNTDRQHPINRSQAYRIVKEAAAQTTNSRMVTVTPCGKRLATTHGNREHSPHCLWVCSITLPMMSPNAILELSRMKRILSI